MKEIKTKERGGMTIVVTQDRKNLVRSAPAALMKALNPLGFYIKIKQCTNLEKMVFGKPLFFQDLYIVRF